MKFRLSIFTVIYLCFAKVSPSQHLKLFDNNILYAQGEIIGLPDTIFLYESAKQFKANENYTRLDKLTKKCFKLYYWPMERGGIVDPTLYKNELIVRNKNRMISMKVGRIKRKYVWTIIPDINGSRIRLISTKPGNR